MGEKEAIEQVQNELKLWNTTYMDMILIHWCTDNNNQAKQLSSDPTCHRYTSTYNATLCRQHTWKGLIQLFNNKTVKAIGVSNWEIKHLNDIINYKYPLDGKVYLPTVNQMQFHGYWHEYDLVEYCESYQILVNAYAPLGTPDIEYGYWKPVLTQHPVAINIGIKYNKSAAQVWLKWILQQGMITNPRSWNISHQQENLDIFDFTLNQEEMLELASIPAPPGNNTDPKVCPNPQTLP